MNDLLREIVALDMPGDAGIVLGQDVHIPDEVRDRFTLRLQYIFLQKLDLPRHLQSVSEVSAFLDNVDLNRNSDGRTMFECLSLVREAMQKGLKNAPPNLSWLVRAHEIPELREVIIADLDAVYLWRDIRKHLPTLPRSGCLIDFPVIGWGHALFFSNHLETDSKSSAINEYIEKEVCSCMGFDDALKYGSDCEKENAFCKICALVFGLPFRICKPCREVGDVISHGFPPDKKRSSLPRILLTHLLCYQGDTEILTETRGGVLAFVLSVAKGKEPKAYRLSLRKGISKGMPIRQWVEKNL